MVESCSLDRKCFDRRFPCFSIPLLLLALFFFWCCWPVPRNLGTAARSSGGLAKQKRLNADSAGAPARPVALFARFARPPAVRQASSSRVASAATVRHCGYQPASQLVASCPTPLSLELQSYPHKKSLVVSSCNHASIPFSCREL